MGRDPSLEATNLLMNHDGIALILATGGNAMVKAAYSCGKPALGVGAGNVPAYVHKSAVLKRSINDLVISKAFDNGMVCASEQAVILDTEIYDEALALFDRLHAYRVTADEKAKLEEFIFGVQANGENCAGAKLNPNVVGKSPQWIAEQAGFSVPEETSIILAEVSTVGESEPSPARSSRRCSRCCAPRPRSRASTTPSAWSSSTAWATRPRSTRPTTLSSRSSASASRRSA
ncbi:hypothetical protein GCM10025873_15200 [Demequina sediminis]|nr:hypothetical protein GCM10025873_15200 [Demequina sediminis]